MKRSRNVRTARLITTCAVIVWETVAGKVDFSDSALFFDNAITAALVKVADSAFGLNQRGMEALDRGDIDGALAYFEEALRVLPNYVDAENNRAVVYYRKGLISRARQLWTELLERNPNYAIGHYNLGIIHFHEKNYNSAFGYFQKASKLHRSLVEARVMQGRCRLAMGKTRDALDDFKAAYKIHPNNPAAWGFLAYGLTLAGDTLKALSILREHPDHAAALELMGVIEMRRGNVAAGLDLLQKAVAKGADRNLLVGAASIQLDRQDCRGALATLSGYFSAVSTPSADAFLIAAAAARDCEDIGRARQYLEQGLSRHPSDALIRNNLGRVYFMEKRYDLAERMLGSVLDTADDAERSYLRAICARESGDLAMAERMIGRAIAIDGKAEYYDFLGTVLYAQGRRQEAIRQFKKALDLKPDLRSAQVNMAMAEQNPAQARAAIAEAERELASCSNAGCVEKALRLSVLYYHVRNYEAAVSTLKRIRQPTPLVYRTLAFYYRELHQWDKVIEVLEKAQAAWPNDTSVVPELADAYFRAGRHGHTIELLRSMAAQGKGEMWRVHYQLGQAYLEQNVLDSAEKCFVRTLQERPDNPAAQGMLAFVYHRKGQSALARELWRKNLEKDPNNSTILINLGLSAEAEGRCAEALDYYLKAKSVEINDPSIDINIGNALACLQRFEESLHAYTRVLSSPKRELAAYNAFLLELKRGNVDRARSMLSILSAEFPKSDYTRRAKAEMALTQADTASALTTLRSLKVREPSDFALMARIYAAQGEALKAQQAFDSIPATSQWVEVRRYLEPAIAFAAGRFADALRLWEVLGDTSHSIVYNMAVALFRLKDYENALSAVERLVSRMDLSNENKMNAFRLAAQAAAAAKDWNAARLWNKRLVQLQPADAVALYNIAVACYNLGDIDCSWEYYCKARSIDQTLLNRDIENRYAAANSPQPTTAPAGLNRLDSLYNKAVSLQSKGNDRAAEKIYRQIIEQDQTHAQSWNNLGTIYAGKGKLKEAEKCYLNAVKNAQGLPEAFANLINLYVAQEKWQQADMWIKKAMSAYPGNELLLQLLHQVQNALH